MRKLTPEAMLRHLQREINELRKTNVEEIDSKIFQRKIEKAKAIGYLVSIAIRVYENHDLEREIEKLKALVEEMRT